MFLLGCAGPPPERAAPLDATAEVVDDGPADTVPPGDLPPVYLSEVMTHNDGVVEDSTGESPDWIELHNPGDEAVDLAGWGLSDGKEGPRFVFPSTPLPGGGFLVVYASGSVDSTDTTDIHLPFALSDGGETLTLFAPDGTPADTLVVPALRADTSYGPAQVVTESTLLATDAVVAWSAEPAAGWEAGGDSATWEQAPWPLGFDLGGGGKATELSLFRPTGQSSDGYGYTGAQATDGELSTFSHTGDADLDPWWRVDLGADYAIASVTLHNRRDCCGDRLYNVVVTVEDEAGEPAWTSEVLNPVAEGVTPTSPGTQLAFTPGGSGAGPIGRYVRVAKSAVNGAYSSEWLSLAEVVVIGAPPHTYPALVATDVSGAMAGKRSALAIVTPFDVPAESTRVVLRARYDDGYVAFVDEAEVVRVNVGTDGAVAEAHDGTEPVESVVGALSEGSHTLAIEAHNLAAGDPDFLFGGELVAQSFPRGEPRYFASPTPGGPNGPGFSGWVETPTADPPRGFYDAPQVVTLATSTPEATLVYTLDGSAPSLDHGVVVPGGPTGATTTIEVTTTAIVRARAFADDHEPSDPVSFTWLFLDDVIEQPTAPAGFPATWYDPAQGSFAADYQMDPEVVAAYHDDLLVGLRAIPTLSVVMDPDELFGDDGIYVRSLERGDEWEREAALEYLLPDGATGFATTAGIRIHGYGWRYHSATLKHAFRLEFSPTWGPSKLEYPLFPDAPITEFDSIVLRSQGSRGWQDFRDPEQACYIRDAFARDLARDLGKVDGHATYVHLYLNGLYWGLYMPVERPDAGFAEEYFGGDDADYDAINRRTSTNEAIDGTLDAYNELLALVDEDVADPAVYAAIEDRLEVDDLVDYMILQEYTVNRDGPCCFDHNNMRGVASTTLGIPFHFFLWDMEYSVWYATDDTNVDVDVPGSASHMYARLRESPTFRARYAERAAAHLAGPLSPESTAAAWEARATEIEDAIVAESARWGDTTREPPYTRDVEWQAERERLLADFFPYRTDELAAQLRSAGLLDP